MIELLANLPSSFNAYKPNNDLPASLLKKAEAGRALYTLKRDGVCLLVIVKADGEIEIRSRRALLTHDLEPTIPLSVRFPHLVIDLCRMKLPPNSLLTCELVMPEKDDFKLVTSYMKSLTPEALQKMVTFGQPALYWWDLLFHGGEDLTLAPTKLRYEWIRYYCASKPQAENHILPLVYGTFPDTATALAYAKEAKIEGWVVVDPDGVYGDRGWNLKGKPDRPAGCGKLKPVHEDDFIVYWPETGRGEMGNGRHEQGKQVKLPNGQVVEHGGLGSVALYQYNAAGELVYCGDCSSGMSYEYQAQLRPHHFPFVAKIEFSDRTYMSEGDKSNKLRFPVFVMARTDKLATECVNERL